MKNITNALLNPMYENRYKLISSWIKPRTLILDVGCGEGYFMERLNKEKEAVVRGIDVSHTIVRKLKETGFDAYVRDVDIEGLKLGTEIYDYILFIEVLEHLKFPHKVLKESCNHVKESIIITIPNTGFIKWRLQLLKGYFPRQSLTHLHYWTIKDIKIFVEQIGLKPVEVRTEIDLIKNPLKRRLGKNCRIYLHISRHGS
ncbi:MAG: methionine biosynthesis protein MetW [Ignisphaera sp.]